MLQADFMKMRSLSARKQIPALSKQNGDNSRRKPQEGISSAGTESQLFVGVILGLP